MFDTSVWSCSGAMKSGKCNALGWNGGNEQVRIALQWNLHVLKTDSLTENLNEVKVVFSVFNLKKLETY